MSKEALAKQEQGEPVAWRDRTSGTLLHEEWLDADPLYATPQQRTWVHLTNQEHDEIAIECGCLSADWVFYGAAVERKVREKNS
jgi:hypothetical protein